MSKSDFSIDDLKDVYATHKIKDEIEWGVHIRETRRQGEQIELTPRSVEAPPVVAYRHGKKRKRKKKRSAITATIPPEKVSFNRDTCSRKQYVNMLSTPRTYVLQPEKEGFKPILTPCPPRFVQLSLPKKQHIFNTWHDYVDVLPAKNIMELQRLLEKEEALGPKDASRYFKELHVKKKQEKKLKEKMQKQVKISKPKRTKVMKEISKLVDRVINFLTKKPTAEVKYRHMMITEIIKQKLENNKIIKPYKRSDNNNINAKTVHEVLDQLAVWLDTNIDIDELEEVSEEELSELSSVSTITYINMLLSISDSMKSELEEAEKASITTIHAIEEVLEEIYELSETDIELLQEEILEEAEAIPSEIMVDREELEEPEALETEAETEDEDSGIVADIEVEEELEEEEFEDEDHYLDFVIVEAEEDEEELFEEAEEAEPEEEGQEIEIEELEGEEELLEEVEEGVEEVEEEVEEEELAEIEVPRSEEEEIPAEVSIVEELEVVKAEAEPEAEEKLPIEAEEEDVEQMQRDLLNEFYETQVMQLLVSKEEISVLEVKPPSALLEPSLMALAEKASITVEEHSPGTVCCLSLKTWATWILEVAQNSQIWCQWIQSTIAQLKYYASVLSGKETNEDGTVKTLSQDEWTAFVDSVEKDIISWRQYNMHVQDLSEDIIGTFANKRVICCPECLKSKLIISEETAHEVSDHLVEAIKTSAYWRRWLNSIMMETEKLTSIKVGVLSSITQAPSTSAAASRSMYELIEFRVPVKRESTDSVFIIEEIERDEQ